MLGWQAQASPDPAWAQASRPPHGTAPPAILPADSAPLRMPGALDVFRLALRRAFRLYIDPREVTETERAA
ncbi:MAG TPA: hypothetical protein VKB80_24705, partial [Kofleriaceae bacterium]|nr:hypothetical protein [Kofleriaceae bacterium]